MSEETKRFAVCCKARDLNDKLKTIILYRPPVEQGAKVLEFRRAK